MVVPVLCCCARAFSSYREWGLLSVVVCTPLIAGSSLAAECRLQAWTSVVWLSGLAASGQVRSFLF